MSRFTIVAMLLISGWLLAVADADIQTVSLQLEGSAGTRTEDYRLGPGDAISITVDSVDEISLQYTISKTGRIIFPMLLEPLKAQELTLEQLPLHLIKLLTQYMYEPRLILLCHLCNMEFLCGTYAENHGNPLGPSKSSETVEIVRVVSGFGRLEQFRRFDRRHSWEEVL